MKIIQATERDFNSVKYIVQITIQSIYPLYYPAGAVRFFMQHHSDENIEKDIAAGNVYVICDADEYKGTVTVHENEIDRLFVLPAFHCQGYGTALINFAEDLILRKHNKVILAASFSAKKLYKKQGYVETEYNVIKTESGDFLCFDMMRKECHDE